MLEFGSRKEKTGNNEAVIRLPLIIISFQPQTQSHKIQPANQFTPATTSGRFGLSCFIHNYNVEKSYSQCGPNFSGSVPFSQEALSGDAPQMVIPP
jgi:hypothetical protein